MTSRTWTLPEFGIRHLTLDARPVPEPGPGEVRVAVRAMSLNYRDLMVVRGLYNPQFALPATPLSDAAGVVEAVGPGVEGVAPGDRVMSHFVAGWQDGPFDRRYLTTTLGLPGPGVAAEHVVLPADAVLPIPEPLDFAQAATLPIAALTAWSALTTDAELPAGGTVLTLGTGGVSVFATQLGAALGARVIVTSSSDQKLTRVRALGAAETINYRTHPRWEQEVLERTGGHGVDVVVENGGAGTLSQSLRCTRPGGTVALLGALTGLRGEVDVAPVLMQRLKIHGIMVNHRAAFRTLVGFLDQRHRAGHALEPVIDRRLPFDQLPAALTYLAQGEHFGKIVLEV